MTSATPPTLEDQPAEALDQDQHKPSHGVVATSSRHAGGDEPDPLGQVGPAARPRTDSPASGGRKVKGRLMKLIRRTHLYTGLLLLPWVLLFGVSGFLFNHEDLFRESPEEKLTPISTADLQKDLGFAKVDADAVAAQIIEKLNAEAGQGSPKFTLASGASLQGLMTFNAGGDNVRHTFNLDLNQGKGVVATVPTTPREEAEKRTTPPYAGQEVQVAALPMDGLAQKIDDMTYEFGIDSDGKWASRGRGGGPEVRFKMDDDQGRRWHVSYNVLRGTLGGRAADEPPTMNFAQTVTRLHKLHHYPAEVGPRFIWMIAADATALTMVFWGISGLIMWWQMKPTRTIGIAALSLCGVIGFVIFMSVLGDLDFNAPVVRGGRPPAAAPTPSPEAMGEPASNMLAQP